jgi:hypothetical protein
MIPDAKVTLGSVNDGIEVVFLEVFAASQCQRQIGVLGVRGPLAA